MDVQACQDDYTAHVQRFSCLGEEQMIMTSLDYITVVMLM